MNVNIRIKINIYVTNVIKNKYMDILYKNQFIFL